MDKVLAILDARIAETEALYRAAENDKIEIYMQGCWEEAKRIAIAIRALGQSS